MWLSLIVIVVEISSALAQTCPYTFGMFRDPVLCDVFYICNWGNPVRFQCGETLMFNTATNNCDWPYNVPECISGGLVNAIGDPRCNGQFGNVADETDCHKYFRCGTGVVQMTCGPFLAYNRILDFCDFEANVPECGIPTDPPTTAAPTTTSPPPTTQPTTTPTAAPTCVEVTPDPSGACPALPPIIPDANGTTICGSTQSRKKRDISRDKSGEDCGADGDYAHSQNQHAYIRCIQGVSVERKCSHGLVFSSLMSRCDYAY